MSDAIKTNKALVMLDMFDCDFEEEGALSLAEALLLNKTLLTLRLANTHAGVNGSTPLINAVVGS